MPNANTSEQKKNRFLHSKISNAKFTNFANQILKIFEVMPVYFYYFCLKIGLAYQTNV